MPPKRTRSRENTEQPTARGHRAARAWADLTCEQLATKVDRSPRTVYRWEVGETIPHPNDTAAIAKACGVPVWLADGQLDEHSSHNGRGTT